MTAQQNLAPGMRVEIRDAEWRIKRVDRSTDGGHVLTCEGLSELVRGREAQFLDRLELEMRKDAIRILDPAKTVLVDDLSPGYRAGILFVDTVLRKNLSADHRISLGHRAALDPLPYQLTPALQAMQQPRQRILIADAVGLGKTLEAGILVSELIARGHGKRILVLAVKSMLAQFQQEFWNRFTIPLVRLDSVGLQRVRNRIPANHNPFHHYDRAIISIDTLKQDIEYRHYLEQAYWDIIIIDEAQNVAERSTRSQRSRLARLLAGRSDTLIMLSATPHDGRAESFASLMNMLDPTAIADPSDYTHEDFRDKGLVVRRFKKDVQDQLADRLPERQIEICRVKASAVEEKAYSQLESMRFHTLDGKSNRGGQLFRTTLKKALFSSPQACLSTIDNRIRRLEKRAEAEPSAAEFQADIEQLQSIRLAVANITPDQFSKYQLLLQLLSDKGFGWTPKDPADRLVIFTESIKTLEFLEQQLPQDLNLKINQLAVLRGDRPDRELMQIVEQFGQKESRIRVLVCSDVASEGINLHHLSHRLIHFDIPWSLMVFQQRNGRIDRYGQQHRPQIRYLVTESEDPAIRGDQRVLEVLINKDDQASKNIGDPSEFLGLYNVEDEEDLTAEYLEKDEDDISGIFAAFLDDQLDRSESPLAAFIPKASSDVSYAESTRALFSLFIDDFAFAVAAVEWLRESGIELQADIDRDARRLTLTAPEDLRQRLRQLPNHARPEGDRFILTPDSEAIEAEIRQRRDEESPWAQRQYLWPLHPVMEWLTDRALGAFGRHTAPVFRPHPILEAHQDVYLLHGGYPNRRGYPLIQAWLTLYIEHNEITDEWSLEQLVERLKLIPNKLPNRGIDGDTTEITQQLEKVVAHARKRLKEIRKQEEGEINERLELQMRDMDDHKTRHKRQLELDLDTSDQPEAFKTRRRQERESHIDKVFNDYLTWLEDTQTIEDEPYLQVVAVFTGKEAKA